MALKTYKSHSTEAAKRVSHVPFRVTRGLDDAGRYLMGKDVMLKIRKAGPEDKGLIHKVHLAAAGGVLAGNPSYLDDLIRSGGVLIAELDSLIIGFGSIDTKAMEQIKHLYILPKYQGSGVGSMLLEAIEEVGWRAGLDRLRLHSAKAAVGFYERQGYREAEPGEVIGHDHEGVEMIKRLRRGGI
jgi:GNAT superfamily N-acetyltransferase